MRNNQLITKANKLTSASYSLGIPEQRIIFLAIIKARAQDKLIDARGMLNITAKSYQEQFNVEKHTAYDALKSAASGLFEAQFEYDDIHEETGKPTHRIVRWVQQIGYIKDAGMIELQFTDAVIPLITRLSEQYTEYDLKQVSELQSEYAIRLYEIMMQWKAVGTTNKISLKKLRFMLGVKPEQYLAMSDFKKRVLNHGIKQINDHTDITADYEQYKTGKAVTDFTFKFKRKPQAKVIDADTANDKYFIKMTDKQINTFSSKLATLPELGSNAPIGKSTAEYAAIIATDLTDSSKQKKYIPYLEKVGYKQEKSKG
ncbi:replication initiation protein RepM [Psychrobacter sp. GP33]|uniref:replication initiation protein RepM n=1 Tax=Psychrobacter sp. GP33 TaxID=2758709 RepID=UPI0015FD3227|nr:replication initiation protein RepM [Psychrobacter sp. GP33]